MSDLPRYAEKSIMDASMVEEALREIGEIRGQVNEQKQLPESMGEMEHLRKWCLECAFERRALMNVPHMEVTNVAEDYYRWIMFGESQSNRGFGGEQGE